MKTCYFLVYLLAAVFVNVLVARIGNQDWYCFWLLELKPRQFMKTQYACAFHSANFSANMDQPGPGEFGAAEPKDERYDSEDPFRPRCRGPSGRGGVLRVGLCSRARELAYSCHDSGDHHVIHHLYNDSVICVCF